MSRAACAFGLAVAWCATACDSGSNPNDTIAGGAPRPAGPAAAPSQISALMTKLAKGPSALTALIGNELNTDPPPWDQLQNQTTEYVTLVADLANYDPPKGSKESWTRNIRAYSELAAALQKGVAARDADAALTAHGEITRSCMACHREHRPMGPGGGPPRR